MKLRRPFLPPLLAIVRGIISTVLLVALLLSAWSSGPASAADAGGEDGTLEIFRLADRSNLKRLNNGDFLFRLARDLRSGIVYWAYMRSEEHTSELQSLMRISYAVFCLKKKQHTNQS